MTIMKETVERDIEIIVNTLLQVSDCVVEVSKAHVVTRIWEREGYAISDKSRYLGKKITEAGNNNIFIEVDNLVTDSFKTGKNGTVEYTISNADCPSTFTIKVLTIHPDREFLLTVIRNASEKEGARLIEDKWKVALDASGDGMWDVNMQTGAVFFSDKWHEIFGYTAIEVPTLADWTAKFHPDDLSKTQIISEEYLAGKLPFYSVEVRYLTKEGVYRWILSKGVLVSKTPDGKPLRFIGTHTDITTQKNAEGTLESQRVFYEQILNSIPRYVFVLDPQRRYLFINPIAVKDEELRKWLIGKTDEEYCRFIDRPQHIAERRKEIFNTALQEREQIQWEEKLINASGEMEYHLHNMYPVFNKEGALKMMIGYGQNVTDKVHAQEALKTSRDTFASAFDYSGIGMALIGIDGKWLDVNNVLCEMTGYSKEELLKLTLQDITYPDDLYNDHALVKKLLSRQISTYNIEKRYVSSKKKIVLASLTVSVVWNNDDSPKFFTAQVVDITKRKALEDEINRKNADLEATKTNLINKINQLEGLSHIIAHNLRGPAANIKMLSGALLADHKGGEHAAHSFAGLFTDDEALELIKESSETLMGSLATLMEITEIKLNKEIPHNDCDIKGLVDDVTTHLYSTIFEKHAVVKLDLGVPKVSYPKAYLENILYNFISNALKYSRPDVPPEIVISTFNKNGRVVISVKDNGLGIDMEKYGDKVFKLNEVFHRGYDSKGVGLYITKTQVESLGGTIEVKSRVNVGSEFIVNI